MCKKNHAKLWLYFTAVIFGTTLIAFLLMFGVWIVLFHWKLISINPLDKHLPILWFLTGSILVGCMVTLFVGKLIIHPIQTMSDAFDELSKGNFNVKVPDHEHIDEIREMAQHFNSMTYDLSHIETLRDDFVVNVSHEFKTPIAAIEGYATLLQEPSLSEEKHRRYVEKILDNSRRLSNLLSNILLLSKLENQETILHQQEYRLDEQLRKAVLHLESKWSEKKLEFDMDLPRVIFYGSEPLLDQVWINILDNAVKHSPDGGMIRIELDTSDAGLAVTISDQGEGMPEEVQKHIFEKFYQGDRSRTSEGNGLGLALVKRIVELCGGTVSVNSAPGNGADFTVTMQNHTGNQL